MDQLVCLVVVHTLPLDQMFAFSLSLYSVQNSPHDHHKTKESCRSDLMAIKNTRQPNTQQNPCCHNQCENHSTKVFDRVKDEYLPNSATNGEHEKVQVNLGVIVDKCKSRVELLGVYKGNGREDGREGASSKHQFDHGKIWVALEHPALKLTRETIKKEEQEE